MSDVRYVDYYRRYPAKPLEVIFAEMEAQGYIFEGGIPGDYSAPMCEHHVPRSITISETTGISFV